MAAALPEEFAMEYDMLQLDDHDHGTHASSTFPVSPSSFFMTEADHAAQADLAANTNHLADDDAMINDLLMEGEHFLSEMDLELSQKQLESTVESAENCELLASPSSMDSPCSDLIDALPGHVDLASIGDCPYAYMMSLLTKEEQKITGSSMLAPASPSAFQHQQQQPAIQHHDSVDLTTEDDADDSDEQEDVGENKQMPVVEEMPVQEAEKPQSKKELDLLQKEAKYLEAQYDYLLSRAKSQKPQRTGVKAKRRGREPEPKPLSQDNKLLNELVSQQQVYLDNFKAMLAFAPVNDVRMALATPMETYIHLGRDFDERRRTILSVREDKLDMTFKYIESKAQGLNLDQPYQYSDMFEKFGKNYCVNFAISKYEGVSVQAVARAIYEQIAGKDEALVNAMGCMTMRESYDQIRCNFMHQRIVSSMKWNDDTLDNMPDIESNAILYNRFDGNTAILAVDYIDKDDLYPYLHNDRIRKDVSSGVVLSEHVDANGQKSVIMKRFLMAKFHMYPHHASKEQNEKFFDKLPIFHEKMRDMITDKLNMPGGTDTFCCPGVAPGPVVGHGVTDEARN